jgi:type IV secretion system protein VirB9
LPVPRNSSTSWLGAIERLNFGYSIEGDRPLLRLVRAFDDGRQVFIEFPPSLATGEAPPRIGQ